jgi:hypothetical protein
MTIHIVSFLHFRFCDRDNPPSGGPRQFTLFPFCISGSVIGTIPRAVDRDSADANNNRICYYILAGDCDDLFELKKKSGDLIQNTQLDRCNVQDELGTMG